VTEQRFNATNVTPTPIVFAKDEYTFTRPADAKQYSLRKNAVTGQWIHGRGYEICGSKTTIPEEWHVPEGESPPICMSRAGSGTAHVGMGFCSNHIGNSTTQLAGARRMTDLALRKGITSLAQPIEIEPADALRHLVWEAAGNVAFLGARCADLGLQIVGDVYSLTRFGEPIATSEDARALVKLYGEERDRLAKVSKMALDAGIAEREVRLMEDQAAQIVSIFRTVVMKLALSTVQQREALAMVTTELRKLSGGDAIVIEART
jgi:hypothetical protein